MLKIWLILLWCGIGSCFAMLADGIHGVESYEELAKEKFDFDAACAIQDHQSLTSQTGVLIAPDIIATAAHGIVHILQYRKTNVSYKPLKVDDVWVTFFVYGQPIKVKVDSVIVDARYTESSGLQPKYDIALIKLESPIFHIQPAQIFNARSIPDQSLMTVVSFGMADRTNQPLLKRAFRLYEYDNYQLPYDDEGLASNRSILKSSLFFKPNQEGKKPSLNDEEEKIRVYDATINWSKDNKKPYALALPGTSGSPVFVRVNVDGIEQEYLFGLVTSFAHLSGSFQAPKGQSEHEFILRNPDKAFNQYQTIFALFYQEDNNPLTFNRESPSYRLDPTFEKLFHTLQHFDG